MDNRPIEPFSSNENPEMWAAIVEWQDNQIDALKAELAVEKDKTRWRRFGDEKPECGLPVVLIRDGNYFVADFFDDERWWFDDQDYSKSVLDDDLWLPITSANISGIVGE